MNLFYKNGVWPSGKFNSIDPECKIKKQLITRFFILFPTQGSRKSYKDLLIGLSRGSIAAALRSEHGVLSRTAAGNPG